MNTLEQAVMESRIESAENRIRSEHNDLESKKFLERKHIFHIEMTNC